MILYYLSDPNILSEEEDIYLSILIYIKIVIFNFWVKTLDR